MVRRRLRAIAITLVLSNVAGCFGRSQRNLERIEQAHREVQLGTALYVEEQNVPQAIEHLNIALELDPENYDAYTVLGTIHLGMGDFSTSEGEFRRALELMIAQEAAGHDIATARNFLGAVLIAQERYEEAVEPLRAAANDELFREPHLAWGNLGFVLLELDRHEEAIEALQRAVELGPRFCVGYYYLGRAYYETEQWEDAEIALGRSVESDPACAVSPRLQNAWRLRGEVRARLGYEEDAMLDFERCVELGPRSPDGMVCQRLLDGAQS